LLARGAEDALDLVVSVVSKDSAGNLRQNTGTLANGFRFDGPVLRGPLDSISYECLSNNKSSLCSRENCSIPWKWNETWYAPESCGVEGTPIIKYDTIYPDRTNFPTYTFGVPLTLKGLNFALHDTTAQVAVSQSLCTPSVWLSDSSVRSIPANGAEMNWNVSYFRFRDSYLNFEAQITKYLSYDKPSTMKSQRTETASNNSTQTGPIAYGNAAAKMEQIILGVSYVPFDYTPIVRLAGTSCEYSRWVADTGILCRACDSVGATQAISGTVATQFFTTTRISSYDLVGFSSLQVQNVRAASSLSRLGIRIWASVGLASFASTAAVRVSASAAEISFWISRTSLRCQATSGKGQSARIIVTQLCRGSSFSNVFSYDNAQVSRNISTTFFNTGPLVRLVKDLFLGSNLGIHDVTPRGAFGQTSSEFSRWSSDTMLRGRVPVGITLADLLNVVTAEVKVHTFPLTFSFDLVQVLPVQTPLNPGVPSNFPATGGSPVTISGINLGNYDSSGRGRIHAGIRESTAIASICYGTFWTSTTNVRCLVPTGVRGTAAVSLTVILKQSTLSTAFTYDVSVISGQKSANVKSDLGMTSAQVIVAGNNFGRFEDSFRLQGFGTVAEVLLWLSDSQVNCNYARGIGGSGAVVLTAGERRSPTLTRMASYELPTLLMQAASDYLGENSGFNAIKLPRNKACTGSSFVYLTGQGFGKQALQEGSYSVFARLGLSGCEVTIWVAETSVGCRASSAQKASARVSLTVGVLVGSLSNFFSQDSPAMSSLFSSNVLVSPTSSVTSSLSVAGSNLGMQDGSIRFKIGHTSTRSTVWVSDTIVTSLLMPASTGQSHKLLMTSLIQVGTGTYILSYDIPSIHIPIAINIPATGASSITLFGVQLARSAYSSKVRIGQTGSTVTIWRSASSLQALAPWGINLNTAARVTIQSAVNSLTSSFTFNDYQSLSNIFMPNSPSTGSSSFTVHGAGFGVAALSSKHRLLPTAAESSGWASDSSLKCRIFSGIERSREVYVTFGNSKVQSSTSVFSFNVVRIKRLQRANSASTGAVSISIAGSALGPQSFSLQAGMLFTGMEVSLWISDSSLVCKTAGGYSATRLMSVTAGKNMGSQTRAFSLEVPRISALTFWNVPSTGSASLTLAGESFSFLSGCFAARIGMSKEENSVWISDTSLYLKTPAGRFNSRRIQLTVGERIKTLSRALSFLGASISTASPANSRTVSREAYFFLSGQSFASAASSLRVSVGSSKNQQSLWVSDTAISTKSPNGVSSSRKVIFSSAVAGTSSFALSYDGARVSTPVRSNFASTGSISVSLAAAGFGVSSFSVSNTVGLSMGENSFWISDTCVRVKEASGVKPTLNIVVTAGARVSTITEILSFQTVALARFSSRVDCESKQRALFLKDSEGWIASIGGNTQNLQLSQLLHLACVPLPPNVNMAKTAFASITVMGSSFGNTDWSSAIRVGFTGMASTHWVSDSSLHGRVVMGILGSNSLLTTLLDRIKEVTISAAFTFDLSVISSSSPYNDHTKLPSVSVSISGHNFGCYLASCSARLLQTDFDMTLWLSDTSIRSMRGDRVNRATSIFSATCGIMASSTTQLYSNDVPVINRMHRSNLSPLDSLRVFVVTPSRSFEADIYGSNYASFDSTPRMTLAATKSQGTFWISDSVMTAVSSRLEVGHSRRVVLSAGLKVGTISNIFSYDSSNLRGLPKANSASTGSVLMLLIGGRYGLASSTAEAMFGVTSAESSRWLSDSACLCSAASGNTKSRIVTLTAGEQVGSCSEVNSFYLPMIDSTKPKSAWIASTRRNALSSGSVSVTIHGSGFVSTSFSLMANLMHSATENSRWVADTSMTCRFSSGITGSHRLAMTVGGQSSSVSDARSYDIAQLSTVYGANLFATGSTSLTLYGMRFSTVSQSAWIRSAITRVESSTWTSDTSLAVKSASAFTQSSKISITAGTLMGSETFVFSYSNPTVSASRSTWLLRNVNVTEKNEAARRNGSLHYGQALVTLSDSWCDQESQTLIPFDQQLLACKTYIAKNLTGDENASDITQTSTYLSDYSNEARILFRAFVVREQWEEVRYARWIVVSNQGCKPGDTLQMCLSAYNILANVSQSAATSGILVANLTICNMTRWVSPTSVQCALKSTPQFPQSVTLDITFGTFVNPFNYGLPFESSNVPTDNPMTMVISGSGFEERDNSPHAYTGRSSAEQTSWRADSSLSVKVQHFIAGTVRYLLTLGKQTGTLTEFLSYNNPSILLMISTNESATGNYLVSLTGSGFASYNLSDHTSAARVGSSTCEATVWISDSHVRCRVSSGVQSTLRLIHTLGARSGTTTEAFSFERPMLSSLDPENSAATGR
jgi:hypothetical protein